VEQRAPPAPPAPPAASRRWLPSMSPATSSKNSLDSCVCLIMLGCSGSGSSSGSGSGLAFPLLPADIAWLLATRPVFLYPELLPVCSLDPALHPRHQRSVYTAGEDGYSTHTHTYVRVPYNSTNVTHNASGQADRSGAEALRGYVPVRPSDQRLPAAQDSLELQETHQRDERAESAARQRHPGDTTVTSHCDITL